MLRSDVCDFSNAYILVKGTKTIANTAGQGQAANTANKKVILKNCAPFANCIIRMNNTQIDDACDVDLVMSLYNYIDYSDNCLKIIYLFLSQYCVMNQL